LNKIFYTTYLKRNWCSIPQKDRYQVSDDHAGGYMHGTVVLSIYIKASYQCGKMGGQITILALSFSGRFYPPIADGQFFSLQFAVLSIKLACFFRFCGTPKLFGDASGTDVLRFFAPQLFTGYSHCHITAKTRESHSLNFFCDLVHRYYTCHHRPYRWRWILDVLCALRFALRSCP